jgi:hypothetical protein
MRHPIAYLIVGLIVAISVGYQLTRMSRGTDVTLTITQAEIVSTGYTEDKYFPSRRRRREGPDLAWRAKRSEEDGPTYPPGIYCGEDCVLPLVSEEEGASIVMTIYFRFSGTGSDSVGDSHKKPSDLTLLHLDHLPLRGAYAHPENFIPWGSRMWGTLPRLPPESFTI